METGSVKFFDSRDNKRFGFLRLESGEEIFFHFNDGENIEAGENEPLFCGGKMKREPKKGDRLVFNRNFGHKGPVAAPWGFTEDYERAKKEVSSRLAPITYRVLEQYTTPGSDKKGEPKVLWEGSDIRALCKKYPRPSDHRMDALQNFSCGDFDKWIRFECMTENGWESCHDPRPIERERGRRW